MYAIIVTGGKQYKVEVGSEIMVEKLDEQIGANVNFDVLMMADGENVQIGTPVVKGVSAKAEVLEHGKMCIRDRCNMWYNAVADKNIC